MEEIEQERRRIEKKLKYKMPVTLRWGAVLGLFAGMVHGGIRNRTFFVVTHTLTGTAIIGLGLCYHDFYLYGKTYF